MTEAKFHEKSVGLQNLSTESIALITNEIRQFTRTWLGFAPRLINIDYHQQAITVTMADILAEAEKNASKYKGMTELIIKNHISAYKSVRNILESKVTEFSGKVVAGSSLMLDPESNCATLLFKFEQ
jgi:uncharacterized protein YbcI